MNLKNFDELEQDFSELYEEIINLKGLQNFIKEALGYELTG